MGPKDTTAPARPRWPSAAAALALIGAAIWWLFPRGTPAPPERPDDAPARIAAAPLAPPPTPPELALDLRLADRAAISGVVKDGTGKPIPGAQVCALAESGRLPSVDTRKAICTLAGPTGKYRLERLFGVRHRVNASAPGFIPAPYRRGEGATRRETVDLRPGQDLRDIDIVLEGGGVLVRGLVKDLAGGPVEGAQVIADYALTTSAVDGAFELWVRPGETWIWAQADGYARGHDEGVAPGHAFEIFLTPEAVLIGKVVRAADGAPIEGAMVEAQSGGWGWGEHSALSDASGAFRIDQLDPGAYKPRAESDDAMGFAEEQVILGLGETSDPVTITAHPALMVEGRIVIEGGASCDSGSVSLRDPSKDRSAWDECEPDGSVRLRGLSPGEYQVDVRCEGLVSEERYDRVVVADKSLAGLTWRVARGQSIRGVVVDSGGRPVARVNISAQAKADPSRPRAQKTNTWGDETDSSGRFELAGLLPGAYSVEVSSWGEPRATPPKPLDVTLTKGRDVDGLRIELPATGEVHGVVVDAKGRGVAKVDVSLNNGVDYQGVSAADDGTFRFAHVAAGEYRVTARRGWFATMRAPGTSDDDVQGEKVSLRAGQTAKVRLVVDMSSGALRGVVRDSGGGIVADAFVEAARESDSAAEAAGGAARTARWGSFIDTPHLTDAEGRFEIADLPGGKYTVRAHRKGGGEATREHVELGEDIELTIAETARLSGAVSLRGGGAPEEFRISIHDEATGFHRRDNFFRTGGAWSLPEVPAGKYKLNATAGPGTAEIEVSVRAGVDLSGLRIELAPKITVRGKVVDLEGAPLPGIRVSASGSGTWTSGDEQKLNVSDEQGHFELPNVPTGRVTLNASPQSWGDSEFGWTSVPLQLDGASETVEIPPIRMARRRVKDGEASGDLGYTLKEEVPGEDPSARRLIVAVVRPGSPAAAAGLLVGDEIVSVDGVDVRGPNAYLHWTLTRTKEGTALNLGLARGASVKLVVGPRP